MFVACFIYVIRSVLCPVVLSCVLYAACSFVLVLCSYVVSLCVLLFDVCMSLVFLRYCMRCLSFCRSVLCGLCVYVSFVLFSASFVASSKVSCVRLLPIYPYI